MTDVRKLLEEAYLSLDCVRQLTGTQYPVTEKIRAYLADTNPSETINYQEVDRSEPVAWMLISTVGSRHYHMSEQQALKGLQMYGGKVIALYDHPAPRPEFVRLSEEEVSEIEASIPPKMDLAEAKKKFARAIEDALEEKNRG